MATALDYSAGRPSATAVKAAGHVGVIRYIGTPGRTKNLTRAEFDDMKAKGISVALVYENHAGDSAGGYSAGQTAARAARADADAIGWPRSRPIYFAVDSDQVTNAQFAAVLAYLDGAASVMGSVDLTGVYGEYDVIEKAVGGHARYGWQTVAWSGGKRSTKAVLFQRLGQPYVGGIQVDINDILATDWGQNDAQEEDMPTAQEFVGALMSTDIEVEPLVPGVRRFVKYSALLRYDDDNLSVIRAGITQLLAKSGGATAAEVAAAILPALTAALTAEVAQLDTISDADAQQIANAVTARAAVLLGGAA